MNGFEPISIYGRRGNVFAARGRNQDSQSHIGLEPSSIYAKNIIFLNKFEKKSDTELLDIAFDTLRNSSYGEGIRERFESKSGITLKFPLSGWKTDFFTGRNDLYNGIKKEIQEKHSQFHFRGGRIDVSRALELNHPSFRIAPFHLDEMIAIGGVQEVEVNDKWLNEDRGYQYLDKNGKGGYKPHTTKIRFRILLKDWFGVDEEDFTNFRLPALLDQNGLAALWVLQHQRGYPPFINIFEHEVTMNIELGVCASIH